MCTRWNKGEKLDEGRKKGTEKSDIELKEGKQRETNLIYEKDRKLKGNINTVGKKEREKKRGEKEKWGKEGKRGKKGEKEETKQEYNKNGKREKN